MRTLLPKLTIKKILTWSGVGVFLLLPLSAFAEVVPLAPLPTNFGQSTDSLGGYLNTIFYTVIAGAAVIAVLRIVWGGFQYMTSEAVTQSKDARTIITMAIMGLIFLLASWLILNIINPDLTKLDALQFPDSLEQVTPPNSGGVSTETRASLSGADDVSNMRKSGFNADVERAVREETNYVCTTSSGEDCSDLYYPATFVYRNDSVEVIISNENPESAEYGKTITKRVGYDKVKAGVCGNSTGNTQIPGC